MYPPPCASALHCCIVLLHCPACSAAQPKCTAAHSALCTLHSALSNSALCILHSALVYYTALGAPPGAPGGRGGMSQAAATNLPHKRRLHTVIRHVTATTTSAPQPCASTGQAAAAGDHLAPLSRRRDCYSAAPIAASHSPFIRSFDSIYRIVFRFDLD